MLPSIYQTLHTFRKVFSRRATWLTFCLVVLGFPGATQIDGVSSRVKSAFGFPILIVHQKRWIRGVWVT